MGCRIRPPGPSACALTLAGVATALAIATPAGADVATVTGESYQSALNLSASAERSSRPAIARSAGVTLVVWEEDDGLQFTWRVGPLDWSAPAAVPGAGGDEPALAADTTGGFHLVWSEFNPLTEFLDVYAVSFTNGTWSLPENVSDTEADSVGPDIAVDAVGRRMVVWSDTLGESRRLHGGSAPPGGQWSVAPLAGAASVSQRVTATRDGYAIIYSEDLGIDPGSSILVIDGTGSTWSDPVIVSAPESGGSSPHVQSTEWGLAASWRVADAITLATLADGQLNRTLGPEGATGAAPLAVDTGGFVAVWPLADGLGLAGGNREGGAYRGAIGGLPGATSAALVSAGDAFEIAVAATGTGGFLDIFWLAWTGLREPTPTATTPGVPTLQTATATPTESGTEPTATPSETEPSATPPEPTPSASDSPTARPTGSAVEAGRVILPRLQKP